MIEQNTSINIIGLFFTAWSISCKQTRRKNRNIMLYKWLRHNYFLYVNSLHKFINNEQYNTKQQTQGTDFSCNISVVCNEPNILFCTLYVVFNNESENKMKAINFVSSILRQTYPSIAHLWYPWNEHSKTNSAISNFLYIEVYSGPLDFDTYIRVLLYLLHIPLASPVFPPPLPPPDPDVLRLLCGKY